jgi:DNA-binding response OmpR family regulator
LVFKYFCAKIKIKTKIAIIEDDAMIAQMYQMKFELDGFSTALANSGESGLKMLDEFKPDLLLLDLKLPGISGVELLEKIRAQAKFEKLPVILLTNSDRSEVPADIEKFEIADYIVKANLTPRHVVEKVKNTLA